MDWRLLLVVRYLVSSQLPIVNMKDPILKPWAAEHAGNERRGAGRQEAASLYLAIALLAWCILYVRGHGKRRNKGDCKKAGDNTACGKPRATRSGSTSRNASSNSPIDR
jgi:hypothetical protein